MASTKSAKIAAIVVSFNRLEKLKECLDCLKNQTYPIDIILVDNDSQDGTEEWVKNSQFWGQSFFHYQKMATNLGGAGGFVMGLEYALSKDYDWLWLLDDDAMADPKAIEHLLHTEAATSDAVAVLSSRVVDESEHLAPMNRQATYAKHRGTLYGVDEQLFQGPPFACDSASFVGFLVRTSVVREVGLPRADFFIHFDDVEYSLRISQRWQIMVVPTSLLIHKVSAMGHSGGYTPTKDLWKLYYNRRNEILVAMSYCDGPMSKAFFVSRKTINLLVRSAKVLSQDHARLRLAIEWRAYVNGLFGRTGKQIDPASFISSLN